MTNEEKHILIKDLCARLPYGVMCKIQTRFVFEDGTVRRGSYDKILDLDTVTEINEWKQTGELEKFKTYLRPMSSMTEEEYSEFLKTQTMECGDGNCPKYEYTYKTFDWLNSHHFDYRGLIGKGLALEEPEEMYNFK